MGAAPKRHSAAGGHQHQQQPKVNKPKALEGRDAPNKPPRLRIVSGGNDEAAAGRLQGSVSPAPEPHASHTVTKTGAKGRRAKAPGDHQGPGIVDRGAANHWSVESPPPSPRRELPLAAPSADPAGLGAKPQGRDPKSDKEALREILKAEQRGGADGRFLERAQGASKKAEERSRFLPKDPTLLEALSAHQGAKPKTPEWALKVIEATYKGLADKVGPSGVRPRTASPFGGS